MAASQEDIELVAQRAVEGVLQRLGVDTSNPLKAQADFQRLRSISALMDDPEFQADLAFMRRWRSNTETIAQTGMKAFVKWFVVGGLGLLVLGTKDWWIRHITG